MVVPKGSKFEITVTLPDGKVEKYPVFEYSESGGVLIGMVYLITIILHCSFNE